MKCNETRCACIAGAPLPQASPGASAASTWSAAEFSFSSPAQRRFPWAAPLPRLRSPGSTQVGESCLLPPRFCLSNLGGSSLPCALPSLPDPGRGVASSVWAAFPCEEGVVASKLLTCGPGHGRLLSSSTCLPNMGSPTPHLSAPILDCSWRVNMKAKEIAVCFSGGLVDMLWRMWWER